MVEAAIVSDKVRHNVWRAYYLCKVRTPFRPLPPWGDIVLSSHGSHTNQAFLMVFHCDALSSLNLQLQAHQLNAQGRTLRLGGQELAIAPSCWSVRFSLIHFFCLLLFYFFLFFTFRTSLLTSHTLRLVGRTAPTTELLHHGVSRTLATHFDGVGLLAGCKAVRGQDQPRAGYR